MPDTTGANSLFIFIFFFLALSVAVWLVERK